MVGVVTPRQGTGRSVSQRAKPNQFHFAPLLFVLCSLIAITMATPTLEIEKLLKVGKELGFKGEDLQQFIEKERVRLREDQERSILKEFEIEEKKIQLQIKLEQLKKETCKLAKQELQKAQKRYKRYYDKKSKPRRLSIGDEILLLLPTDNNKLLMHWKGPYEVIARKSDFDYTINLGQEKKTFHINMLKKYIRRPDNPTVVSFCNDNDDHDVICTSVIEDEYADHTDTDDATFLNKREMISLPPTVANETASDVQINKNLSQEEISKLREVLEEYSNILTDIPGKTNLGEHEIKLIDQTPVRQKPYPAPHALRDKIKKEVQTMIEIGIVEPSDSPYASPLVIVKKPDGSDRYCVDFRALNAKTVFDAEPIPDQSEIFAKLANDHYFSKIDFK